MPFSTGTKLGPYEIQSLIGAGGMGEVYRARDTRLSRIVAIKILPESLAFDPDRLGRFQDEARILSSLNHPNLMAIHDVGSQEGIHFLVSEFLEGQTLRERLEAGPLPQRRVNEYSLQMARGLAAAHEKGIVHRDLKPENIFILADERIKILDFGLAKQVANAAADGDQTLTSVDRTSAGTVLGTAGYMSPEQVRGEPLDHRSDIFNFGAILYEMISGKRAFHGDSGIEVMNSILKEEAPDLADSGVQVPLGLKRIAQRCLEKKPQARFQSASDLAFALDSLSSAGSSTTSLRALKDTSKTRSRILLTVSLAAALAAGAIATLLLNHPATIHPTFTQITFRQEYLRRARFAPDGRTVVYDGTSDGKPTELFSTRTDTAESQALNIHASILSISSTGELAVLLNPDFVVKWTPIGRLARVPLGGGSSRELLDQVIDADWNPDGSSLAVSRKVGNHVQLEFPPGKVLYQNDGYISDLRFSPAGDEIAFFDHSTYGDDRDIVTLVDLHGHRKALTGEFSSVQGLAWVPDGREIWFTAADGSEPRSLRSVNLNGKQRMLLSSPSVLHFQDISKSGYVLINSDTMRDQQVFAETRSGQVRDFSFFPFENIAAISDDSRTFLLNAYVSGPNSDYNLYTQTAGAGSSPVLIGQGTAMGFSPNGEWALALDPIHLERLRIIPTGVGESSTINAPPGLRYIVATWMPDSKHILVVASAAGHAPATYVQDVTGGAARQITREGMYALIIHDVTTSVSPDGQYCLTTDGARHYWLHPMNGGEPKPITGLLEGDLPLQWHNGSQSIFFERRAGLDAIDIYDLNLTTGQQKVWTHFSPTDKTAMVTMRHPLITPDGAQSLYAVQRIYSTLFVAKDIH